MAEAEAGNGENTSTKMESVDNRVSNGHMLELFKKYKDSNYKEAVEQYLQHFAVDKNVQELTVYNRLKANYKRASSLLRGKTEGLSEKGLRTSKIQSRVHFSEEQGISKEDKAAERS